MPLIPIHPPPPPSLDPSDTPPNPLPSLLHTPSGLALLEIQGTIHTPSLPSDAPPQDTLVGRLVFPDAPTGTEITGDGTGPWMKRVYLYVGRHQRMTGEVKKLARPVAVLRKRETITDTATATAPASATADTGVGTGTASDTVAGPPGASGLVQEELEIVEIVRWKILFAGRPEPVSEQEGEKGGQGAEVLLAG